MQLESYDSSLRFYYLAILHLVRNHFPCSCTVQTQQFVAESLREPGKPLRPPKILPKASIDIPPASSLLSPSGAPGKLSRALIGVCSCVCEPTECGCGEGSVRGDPPPSSSPSSRCVRCILPTQAFTAPAGSPRAVADSPRALAGSQRL